VLIDQNCFGTGGDGPAQHWMHRCNDSVVTRRQTIVVWTIAAALIVEAITCFLRFGVDATAAEFNKTAPLLLQMHHMFWSVPLFVAALLSWRKPRLSGAVLGVGFGFILSDLAHHFLVLPLTVGNTGWHWP
jgi:hypothetical protein